MSDEVNKQTVEEPITEESFSSADLAEFGEESEGGIEKGETLTNEEISMILDGVHNEMAPYAESMGFEQSDVLMSSMSSESGYGVLVERVEDNEDQLVIAERWKTGGYGKKTIYGLGIGAGEEVYRRTTIVVNDEGDVSTKLIVYEEPFSGLKVVVGKEEGGLMGIVTTGPRVRIYTRGRGGMGEPFVRPWVEGDTVQGEYFENSFEHLCDREGLAEDDVFTEMVSINPNGSIVEGSREAYDAKFGETIRMVFSDKISFFETHK